MPHKLSESERLQARAERLLPGGVNSPVRAFGAVGGTPPMIIRGEGAYTGRGVGEKRMRPPGRHILLISQF